MQDDWERSAFEDHNLESVDDNLGPMCEVEQTYRRLDPDSID